MPLSFSESDFSAYFTITSAPETFARTISQSFTPTESLSVSVSLFRYERTLGDTLATTDSGLSRSISTFRIVNTESDSLSLSDSLSRATSTFRFESTLSDAFTPSESLNRAIETWRNVVSYNMTLTNSESLSKSVRTWRNINTISDSSTISESLSTNVTTFKHINSINKTLNLAESLNVGTSLWYNPFTNSDSMPTNDGLTIQLTIANDTYFYDKYGMDTSNKLIGYIESGNFTSDTNRLTNVESLYDGATYVPTTYNGATYSKACVVFDFGSQVEVDFIGTFVQSTLTNPLKLYGSNSQGSGYQLVANMFGSSSAWQISDFTAVNYRYYAVQIESMTSNVNVGEFLIGKQFKPEIRFDANASITANENVVLNESFKGNEYAYRTQEKNNQINRSYSSISETLKSQFEDLSNKSSAKKIIYNFDNFYYGFVEPMSFNEVSHNRYQTQISIIT